MPSLAVPFVPGIRTPCNFHHGTLIEFATVQRLPVRLVPIPDRSNLTTSVPSVHLQGPSLPLPRVSLSELSAIQSQWIQSDEVSKRAR